MIGRTEALSGVHNSLYLVVLGSCSNCDNAVLAADRPFAVLGELRGGPALAQMQIGARGRAGQPALALHSAEGSLENES